jgi:calcium-dependent protein kinase
MLLLLFGLSTGLAELFKSIDEDGSGTITVQEMRKALTQWGNKINEVMLRLAAQPVKCSGCGLRDVLQWKGVCASASKLIVLGLVDWR